MKGLFLTVLRVCFSLEGGMSFHYYSYNTCTTNRTTSSMLSSASASSIPFLLPSYIVFVLLWKRGEFIIQTFIPNRFSMPSHSPFRLSPTGRCFYSFDFWPTFGYPSSSHESSSAHPSPHVYTGFSYFLKLTSHFSFKVKHLTTLFLRKLILEDTDEGSLVNYNEQTMNKQLHKTSKVN